MIQPCQRDRLTTEALHGLGILGDFRLQDFDRNIALHHLVHRAVDGSHASFAQLFDDPVIAHYAANHGWRASKAEESPPIK